MGNRGSAAKQALTRGIGGKREPLGPPHKKGVRAYKIRVELGLGARRKPKG